MYLSPSELSIFVGSTETSVLPLAVSGNVIRTGLVRLKSVGPFKGVIKALVGEGTGREARMVLLVGGISLE